MEKNVALPADLLAVVNEIAAAQGKTPDELIEDATRRYVARERLSPLVQRNEERARLLGFSEEDVPGLVRQWRREQRGR
jgi:hypothetical protein